MSMTGDSGWPQATPVQSLVPTCAQTCLSNAITNGYNCPPGLLPCLCGEYSHKGLTLGQLAEQCVKDNCGSDDTAAAASASNICVGQPSVVAPSLATATKAPISTMTVTEKPTTSAPTTKLSTTLTHTASSTETSLGWRTTTISSQRTSTLLSSHSSSATDPPATVPTVPATVSHGSKALSSVEAAGISVALVGGVAAVIIALLISRCLKRRKIMKQTNDRESYDFVDEAPASLSRFGPEKNSPTSSIKCLYGAVTAGKFEKRSKPWTGRERPWFPLNNSAFDFQFDTPTTPRSTRSFRALSKLLPDRPMPTPLRKPLQCHPALRSDSSLSRMSLVPELTRSHLPESVHRTNSSSPKVPEATYSSPALRRSESRSDPVDSGSQYSSQFALSLSTKSQLSLLSYYVSPDPGQLGEPGYWTPVDSDYRRNSPRPALPSLPVTALTNPFASPEDTCGSCSPGSASCSSSDSEEASGFSPPDERFKRLSTVPESPGMPPSPIHEIRYPKVPRSSMRLLSPQSSTAETPTVAQSPENLASTTTLDELFYFPFGSHTTLHSSTATPPIKSKLSSSPLSTDEFASERSSQRTQPASTTTSPLSPRTKSTRRRFPIKLALSTPGTVGTPSRPHRAAPPPPSSREQKLTPTRRGDEMVLYVGRGSGSEGSRGSDTSSVSS